MAVALWARAARMLLLFYQVAILQFTLWGIRVVHLSKLGAWRAAKLIMFLIHIVAIAAVHCKRQLSSGVNVTHRTQANFSQVILDLHLHLHHRKCAQSVALPITIARLIVEDAILLLVWLQTLAMAIAKLLLLHPLLQLPLMATVVVLVS